MFKDSLTNLEFQEINLRLQKSTGSKCQLELQLFPLISNRPFQTLECSELLNVLCVFREDFSQRFPIEIFLATSLENFDFSVSSQWVLNDFSVFELWRSYLDKVAKRRTFLLHHLPFVYELNLLFSSLIWEEREIYHRDSLWYVLYLIYSLFDFLLFQWELHMQLRVASNGRPSNSHRLIVCWMPNSHRIVAQTDSFILWSS